MPKKHEEKVGSLENFQAPWETGAGEVEIDKDRLKRFIYNLKLGEAKALDARDEASEKVTEAEKERDTAKAELAKGDSTGKISELEKQLAEARTSGSKAEHDLLRIKVGGEAGLSIKQSLRLEGATEEELTKDAEEILKDFGVAKPSNSSEEGEEEEGDEEEDILRRRPASVRNPGDPNPESGGQELDYDKVVAGFGSSVRI